MNIYMYNCCEHTHVRMCICSYTYDNNINFTDEHTAVLVDTQGTCRSIRNSTMEMRIEPELRNTFRNVSQERIVVWFSCDRQDLELCLDNISHQRFTGKDGANFCNTIQQVGIQYMLIMEPARALLQIQ